MEAIQIEQSQFALASFWRRFAAWSIDHLIVAPVVAVVTLAYFEFYPGAPVAPTYFEQIRLGMILFYCVDIAYSTLGTWLFGATIGKEILGMKVLMADGRDIGLGKTVMREVIGKLLCQVTLLFGFMMIARDAERRGLHDRLAGTRVAFVEAVAPSRSRRAAQA